MRTMGISPGDAVLVVEHRGEQQIVYNGVVSGITMQPELRAANGEPAIEAAFATNLVVESHPVSFMERRGVLIIRDMVHISHRDWIERRASLGYEELPGHVPGVCRYCKCTEERACRLADGGACSWIFPEHTVCSNPECERRWVEDNKLRTAAKGTTAYD